MTCKPPEGALCHIIQAIMKRLNSTDPNINTLDTLLEAGPQLAFMQVFTTLQAQHLR